ncbi:MAG: hypothetical protein IKF19_02860 [Bacilli bacterium]|nr:hypothetical protein [Bacilli bacterium]
MKKNKYDYDKDYNQEYNNYNDDINDNSNKFKTFLKKYQSDERYKSKVQLMGYLIFIVILVIYLNISHIGQNYNYNTSNTTSDKYNTLTTINENNKELSLLKTLNDNYNYSVTIAITRAKEDNIEENITINYNGKSNGENIIINKDLNNTTDTFYKAGDEYYQKINENYEIMAENEIYDIISAKYIEYSSLKKYIEKASLDHYTNYSSGKVEYVYNLNVSDIIKSYKKDDKIQINIVEENNTITIDIDYDNLFKILNNKIKTCRINYKYSNIGSTEKIVIFDDLTTTTNSTNGSTN